MLNGHLPTPNDGTIYVMALAAGEIDEDRTAGFFRDHIEAIEK